MNKIIPITDLQRQAGQIVSAVVDSDESVIITQRGRPAAVLVSAARYSQIEEDLAKLDELELIDMVALSREALSRSETLTHKQVKARLQKQHKTEAQRTRRVR
jgi:prevent-host-death family protein